MKKNKPFTLFYYIALVMMFLSCNALALETDAEQPITIDSNTATYDDLSATSTYIGNVVSIQGSIVVHSPCSQRGELQLPCPKGTRSMLERHPPG